MDLRFGTCWVRKSKTMTKNQLNPNESMNSNSNNE